MRKTERCSWIIQRNTGKLLVLFYCSIPPMDKDSSCTTHTLIHVPLGACVFVPQLDHCAAITRYPIRNCQSMQQCDSHIQGLSMSQCVLDTSTYLFGLVHNLVNVMSRIDRRTCMPWMMDHLPPDVSKCTA